MDAIFVLLNGVYGDFRMKDIGGAVDGGNSAEGLRNIADSVVHIEIRNFSIHST